MIHEIAQLMRTDTIPVFLDPYASDVYYVPPIGPLTNFPLGYLIGSLSAWGAFYAHNLAAAYRPEGLP